TTWVASGRPPVARPWRTSASIADMNAVRVLPEPVGAATRVWRPEPIAGQACCWASVGPGKARSNQAEPAGWKADRGIETLSAGAVAGSATAAAARTRDFCQGRGHGRAG